MQMQTGGDVLGIQERTLVHGRQLADLDTIRRPMPHGLCIPHSLPRLRPLDFQGSKASIMFRLHFRFLDASQVQCKWMLRRVRLLIMHRWSRRLTGATTNERAFLGKSTV
jgi:hypothetical protein